MLSKKGYVRLGERMFPTLFQNEKDIVTKIKAVAKLHSFKDAQTIAHIFYDVFKIAFLAIKRKKKGNSLNASIVGLKRKDVTRVVKLIDYHHPRDITFVVEGALSEGFVKSFDEGKSLEYFEDVVEGEHFDKHGRRIKIDLENAVKFMYKNPNTGKHEINSKYFKKERGQRLSWIKHTIENTKNIYTRIDGQDKEIMYVSKYEFTHINGNPKNYWVVITKKYKKDRIGSYKLKTAFPVFKYNSLLARIERYKVIESGEK